MAPGKPNTGKVQLTVMPWPDLAPGRARRRGPHPTFDQEEVPSKFESKVGGKVVIPTVALPLNSMHWVALLAVCMAGAGAKPDRISIGAILPMGEKPSAATAAESQSGATLIRTKPPKNFKKIRGRKQLHELRGDWGHGPAPGP